MNPSLHGKKFVALSNSEGGEVSADTIFNYREEDGVVWATYGGGEIVFGTLSGRRTGDELTFLYHHENRKGKFLSGKCRTIITMKDEKLHLHETWEWTCNDCSTGTSVLIECE